MLIAVTRGCLSQLLGTRRWQPRRALVADRALRKPGQGAGGSTCSEFNPPGNTSAWGSRRAGRVGRPGLSTSLSSCSVLLWRCTVRHCRARRRNSASSSLADAVTRRSRPPTLRSASCSAARAITPTYETIGQTTLRWVSQRVKPIVPHTLRCRSANEVQFFVQPRPTDASCRMSLSIPPPWGVAE